MAPFGGQRPGLWLARTGGIEVNVVSEGVLQFQVSVSGQVTHLGRGSARIGEDEEAGWRAAARLACRLMLGELIRRRVETNREVVTIAQADTDGAEGLASRLYGFC